MTLSFTRTRTHTVEHTITRIFSFDYGHRIVGHEGKCKHLHGHRGVAEVTVTSDKLDGLGRIVDFSVLKEVVGKWIDENWDHNMILYERDPLYDLITLPLHHMTGGRVNVPLLLGGDKLPYKLADNPTAENLSRRLFEVASQLLKEHKLTVLHVRFYETPNSFADYAEHDQSWRDE